ncbi:MAG: HAD family hydrolase [Ignavibacteria bacterium]|nr:HAD family hydrolase [Ignavibacteria bacterium]
MPEPFQPSFRSRLSCIIFDIDGTIARSNELIFASFNHVAAKYLGKQFTQKEILALFGPPEEGGLMKIVEPGQVPAAMDDLCSFYGENHEKMVALHPGIGSILRFLRDRNVYLAVFTGKGRRTTTITLEALGVDSFFGKVMTGSDVRRHKPDPEGILEVLDHFQVKPEEALMVGDSVSDIRAARGAGVSVASVLWDAYDSPAVVKEQPDFVFHTVDQLAFWLQSYPWESRIGFTD